MRNQRSSQRRLLLSSLLNHNSLFLWHDWNRLSSFCCLWFAFLVLAWHRFTAKDGRFVAEVLQALMDWCFLGAKDSLCVRTWLQLRIATLNLRFLNLRFSQSDISFALCFLQLEWLVLHGFLRQESPNVALWLTQFCSLGAKNIWATSGELGALDFVHRKPRLLVVDKVGLWEARKGFG